MPILSGLSTSVMLCHVSTVLGLMNSTWILAGSNIQRNTVNWSSFEQLFINCQKMLKYIQEIHLHRNWGKKCAFLYLSVKYLISVANGYFFNKLYVMLPLVRGNFEYRSKWLVLYVPFELPITYINRCKGKVEGIIFNLSDSLKKQILTPYRWIYI